MKRATLEEARQALLPDVPMTLLAQMTLGKATVDSPQDERRARARIYREGHLRLLQQDLHAQARERSLSPQELMDQADAWLR